MCVVGRTVRATKLRFLGLVASRRGTHLERCQVSSPVASLAIGNQAADWEDTAGAEFHTLLLEWDLCPPATLPGPQNDPARPSGTLCSRTRWHRIDFVAVPRDWFAGVKRAEVETAVALPGSGAFDHAMTVGYFAFEGESRVFKVC